MADDVRFMLRPEWMGGLGRLVGVPVNAVSPFNIGKEPELTIGDIDELENKGILDSNGQISSSYQQIMRSMALARSFARVRLTGGEGLFEYITYSTDDSEDHFSLTTTQEGLEVCSSAPTAETIEMLKQYIGDSLIRGSSFEAEVSISEAVVLAALIDLRRKDILAALGGGSTYSIGEVSMEDLDQALNTQCEDAQWLLAVVNGLIDSAPEALAVEMAIKSLQTAGHIVKTASGIKLGRSLENLASRLPVIDKLLSLRSGLDLGSGQVVQVGFVCVQSGVNDLLMIESLGGRIHFESVSPALVIEYVGHFLNRPEVLSSVIVRIEAGKPKKVAHTIPIIEPKVEDEIQETAIVEPVQDDIPEAVSDAVTAVEEVEEVVEVVEAVAEPTPETAPTLDPAALQSLCTVCNSAIPQGGKFCISCGAATEAPKAVSGAVCISCGNSIKPQANFCNKCGVRVNVAG